VAGVSTFRKVSGETLQNSATRLDMNNFFMGTY